MVPNSPAVAHDGAVIEDGASVGDGTNLWANARIRKGAIVGKGCNLGQNAYVDEGAVVGDFCKLQNNVNVYDGVVLEDYVFCGPSMTFTNVKIPRCEFPRSRGGDYYLRTYVGRGSSLGAQCVVVCGVNIGKYAMVGSGSVVCHDVPDHALMVGNPAKQIGWACICGEQIDKDSLKCIGCGREYEPNGCNGLLLKED